MSRVRRLLLHSLGLLAGGSLSLAFGPAMRTIPRDEGPVADSAPVLSSRILQRVVKTFDFDEERLGNFELTPMHWTPLRAPGFPAFLQARLDKTCGAGAAPCMQLALNGGSVAARYEARDIPVHPRSDYLITARVRTDRLVHARAYLSAVFLDRALNEIAGTQQFSLRCGGDRATGWQTVQVRLSGGVSDARWISLTAWLTQPAARGEKPGGLRPIEQADAVGSAWFDDITVMRLPRVALRGMTAGVPILPAHDAALLVEWSDVEVSDLSATLDVTATDGPVVLRRALETPAEMNGPMTVPLGSLSPGAYRATLVVRSADGEIGRAEQPFLVDPGDLPGGPSRAGNWLGLSVDPRVQEQHAADVGRLCDWVGAGTIKLPIWTADTPQGSGAAASEAGDMLRRLKSAGCDVVATLVDLPDWLRARLPSDAHALPAACWRATRRSVTRRCPRSCCSSPG
ncbi:MAG: hypothetical protein U1A27_00445 [Phycisphaerae bacterium]